MANVPVELLSLLIEEQVAQLPLTDYTMLRRLIKRTSVQESLKWGVNVGGATATGEAVTSDVTTFSEDNYVEAKLPIGEHRLRSSFQLLDTKVAQARARGRGALQNLLETAIQSGLRTLMDTVNTKLYSATGVAGDGGLVGITNLSTVASYAGISSATYPGWASRVSSNATPRALTADIMYNFEADIYTDGANYTAIYTTPKMVVKYKKLFAEAQSTSVNTVPNGTADIGFTGLAYAGRPIIQDRKCPAGTMLWVNEPDVALYTFDHDGTDEMDGMRVSTKELSSANPDASKYAVIVKPQLKVHNRRSINVIKDLTE